MEAKKAAAEKAVEWIKEGMVIGLGTGSTAYWAIQKIGQKVKQGFRITAVATSAATEKMARELGIPMALFGDVNSIDITIDGADEVDKMGNLIKGGGGALLREKIIALNSRQLIITVDSSKLVDVLGQFPLPVEIVPFAAELTVKHLAKLGGNPVIRMTNKAPYTTDNGNLIADCHFTAISDPAGLNTQLHMIAGVVETGLFLHHLVSTLVVGYADGSTKIVEIKKDMVQGNMY